MPVVCRRREIHTSLAPISVLPALRPPFSPAAALLAVVPTSINGDHRPHPSRFQKDSRKTLALHLGTTPRHSAMVRQGRLLNNPMRTCGFSAGVLNWLVVKYAAIWPSGQMTCGGVVV